MVGFTATMLEQRGATFEWDVAPIPHFEGKPQSSLIVTDSIVLFKDSKVKEKLLNFLISSILTPGGWSLIN